MSVNRIALAGNPNTGKSTLFNTLTGLKQHTGNWPGKTVVHAEGSFEHKGQQYVLVDLPGTYSLFSNSADEEVARDYIIFDQPDATIVVLDATSLERNLNLALQVLEMTNNVIICINLIDEAEKKGIRIDERRLARELGVPVVKISARNKKGINRLLDTLNQLVSGQIVTTPYRMKYSKEIEDAITKVESKLEGYFDDKYPSRWVALRLLDGDEELILKLQHHKNNNQQEVRTNGVPVSVKS
ncbi:MULTISPECIES: FeoB small GTPase domain-containing protein [Lysinibacillus]|uniref:FeoB small GTPase domain-containing protein n=1 Tax=Lysinibacillus TaxID=400634 RepID=UPI00200F0333|nr:MULTISPECIES: FeoB small GTPase domain-containing protein [Lysinibacillus]MEB2281618.1 50S ribosome-binding GTPase [Lysinibacillus xylanilyticus]UPW83478.1 50S ribosome-binding GTPase [Lysinibacillus sp. Ag94]